MMMLVCLVQLWKSLEAKDFARRGRFESLLTPQSWKDLVLNLRSGPLLSLLKNLLPAASVRAVEVGRMQAVVVAMQSLVVYLPPADSVRGVGNGRTMAGVVEMP